MHNIRTDEHNEGSGFLYTRQEQSDLEPVSVPYIESIWLSASNRHCSITGQQPVGKGFSIRKNTARHNREGLRAASSMRPWRPAAYHSPPGRPSIPDQTAR